MNKIPKNYFQALATMIGYIIGVGMFGLPFLAAKSGMLPFTVILLAILAIQYLVHIIYANMIVATETFHLLPGYTGIYLGKTGKNIVFVANLFSNVGALLAYIIINGIFLKQLLGPYFGGTEFMYASIMFALEALIVFFGIKIIAKAEITMTLLLLFVIGLITWRGMQVADVTNYINIDWRYFFLPYGAMLFSLDGSGCLPILAKLLNKDKKAIKSVIRMGLVISAIVIFAFALVIVGISGVNTTADALSGVKMILDDGVVILALVFGILAIVTSFFGVAESMKKILQWDYKLSPNFAWAISVFVPYLLYLLGINNLVKVISFVGGIGGGISGIALILIYKKMLKMKKMTPLFEKFKPGKNITFLLVVIFMAGIIYEIYANIF